MEDTKGVFNLILGLRNHQIFRMGGRWDNGDTTPVGPEEDREFVQFEEGWGPGDVDD